MDDNFWFEAMERERVLFQFYYWHHKSNRSSKNREFRNRSKQSTNMDSHPSSIATTSWTLFNLCHILFPPILSHITPWYTALFQFSFLFSTLELKKHHQRHLLLFETIPLLLQYLVIHESIHSFQCSDGKWLHLSKVLVLVEKDFGMDSVYFYWANFTMLSNLLCAYYRSLWTVV